MRPVALTALGALLGASSVAAAAPTVTVGELTRCAQITAIDQRLACYDTLAASKMATSVPAPVAAKPGAAAAAGAGAAASAVTVPVPPPAPTGGFGMSTHVAPVEQSVQQVNAHVINGGVDRQGNVYVALDNGQTWSYVDRDGPPENGSEVEIRRASLGSYLLTTPNHHTFRAQRTN